MLLVCASVWTPLLVTHDLERGVEHVTMLSYLWSRLLARAPMCIPMQLLPPSSMTTCPNSRSRLQRREVSPRS